SEAYGKFSKNINFKKIKIKENVYYKLINDLLRLPSDIKHYFKGKYNERNKNTKYNHK
ncbi:TPA: alpha-2,3-sialyltransferase, partial [Campylobacter jejuni]